MPAPAAVGAGGRNGRRGDPPDVYRRCWEAIVLAMLVATVFELTLIKVTGVGFWFFLGLAIAARHHAQAERTRFRSEGSRR